MKSYTIITDKFAFGGKCVGKINGKTVFVPYALPGEELEIEITENKKDYDEGRIVKVLKPSPDRVEPVCPLYQKCGGCNMMHISEEEQKNLKLQVLRELFENNGVTLPEISILSGKATGYRSRFNLNDGAFSERSSNEKIYAENCPIADKNINEYLKSVPAVARPKGRCNLFGSDLLDKKVVIAKIPEKNTFDPNLSLKKKNKNIKMTRKIYSGTQINEDTEAKITLLGKDIYFDARGFFQSNMEVLEKALQETIRGLKGHRVLDMYSGCGTFSVFLADFFEEVTLVEHNRDALVYAEKNLAGKNHISWGMSGKKWVETIESAGNYGTGKPGAGSRTTETGSHSAGNKSNGGQAEFSQADFDAVVIDPPRSGMEKEVRNYLARSNIPQIRAVSCDPATQARDIAFLVKNGYKIQKAFLLDFYPNTSHIESLLYLVKE